MLKNADIVEDFQKIGLPTNCYGKFLHLLKEQDKECKQPEVREFAYKTTLELLGKIGSTHQHLVNQIPAWWVTGIIPAEAKHFVATSEPPHILEAVDKLIKACSPQEAFTETRRMENWGRMKLQTTSEQKVLGAVIASMLVKGDKLPAKVTEAARVGGLESLEERIQMFQGKEYGVSEVQEMEKATKILEKMAPEYKMDWSMAEGPSSLQEDIDGILKIFERSDSNPLHISEKKILFPIISRIVEKRHELENTEWQQLPLRCLTRKRDDVFEFILHKAKPSNEEWHKKLICPYTTGPNKKERSLCEALFEYTLNGESVDLLQNAIDLGLRDGVEPLWKILLSKLSKGGTKTTLLTDIRDTIGPFTKVDQSFFKVVPQLPKAYQQSIPRIFGSLVYQETPKQIELESEIELT